MVENEIGGATWFAATKARLLEISAELRNPETTDERRNELFNQQIDILEQLQEHSHETLFDRMVDCVME
jgi:hypothetical protein